MTLDEAKKQFILSWGALALRWGISRSMGEVHALLLCSTTSLSMEDVMERLDISRGNASMSIRELENWGLVERANILSERREYFKAEKDMKKILRIVLRERRKRELDPIIKLTIGLNDFAGRDKEAKQFKELIAQIRHQAENADRMIEATLQFQENALSKLLKKIF